MRRVVIALVLAGAARAHAESAIELTLNDLGRQVASELGLDVPTFVAQSEARIDELYRLSRTDALLRAFANIAAFAQRGLGVDPDPDPGDVMIGLAGTGFQGDIAIGTENALLAGSSVNAAVMVGVNLARWGHPRWTVFANGFYLATTVRALDGDLLTLGAHVQYRLVPGSRPGRVRWTGLTATTGVEHAAWTVGAGQTLETNFRVQGTSAEKSIHLSSSGTLEVHTSTLGVPLELTTGVRLLDLFVPYVGVGAELATGTSTLEVDLDSALAINADSRSIGSARITGRDTAAPDRLAAHALAGLQLHTRHARIALQATAAAGAWSLALGVRIVP